MLATHLFKYWSKRLFAPGTILQSTYNSFLELLEHDGRCHERMAEFETLYYQGNREDICGIRNRLEELSQSVLGMVENLETMRPGTCQTLFAYHRKFDFYCRFLLSPPTIDFTAPYTAAFDEELSEELVGGKGLNLARMTKEYGLTIPAGFIITANSYHALIRHNGLRDKIDALLATIKSDDPQIVKTVSRKLCAMIDEAPIPPQVAEEITHAMAVIGSGLLLAVRSSGVNEDGACSFAGQYQTVLNVKPEQIFTAYRKVLASKYSEEALTYRIHSGLGDEETGMAVLVLEMVEPEIAGVLYSTDPSGADPGTATIHYVEGQGDALVSGRVIPKVIKAKNDTTQVVPAGDNLAIPDKYHAPFLKLFETGKKIADHEAAPQDIEWALDRQGRLLFLQSRPLAIQTDGAKVLVSITPHSGIPPLLTGGTTASSGAVSGITYRLDETHPAGELPPGSILLLRETLPSHVSLLDRVNGIVAELGSSAGHLATVCREFGIPMLLGVGDDIIRLSHGRQVSLFADHRQVFIGDLVPRITAPPIYEMQKNLPFFKRLNAVLDFITPLKLVDPKSRDFKPDSCRSFHDIIRYCHEQAIAAMFSIGDRIGGKKAKKKKLITDLPLDLFLLDVGDGISRGTSANSEITIHQVTSAPFLALWQGLTHPAVQWEERNHFDWKSFDEIALAGGVASKDSGDFASYAVVAEDYLNLNMRFGYHFTLVDAMCGDEPEKNYCQFRFGGGGGDFSGRTLRIELVSTILTRIGFQVTVKGDLLDSRLQQIGRNRLLAGIQLLGKLLGVTKLMDMRLKDEEMVESQIEDFFSD
ncbi:MAG: PEP/pyruvate-binding domain-containing protein [Thermodesulfobacteriota bacterium]